MISTSQIYIYIYQTHLGPPCPTCTQCLSLGNWCTPTFLGPSPSHTLRFCSLMLRHWPLTPSELLALVLFSGSLLLRQLLKLFLWCNQCLHLFSPLVLCLGSLSLFLSSFFLLSLSFHMGLFSLCLPLGLFCLCLPLDLLGLYHLSGFLLPLPLPLLLHMFHPLDGNLIVRYHISYCNIYMPSIYVSFVFLDRKSVV